MVPHRPGQDQLREQHLALRKVHVHVVGRPVGQCLTSHHVVHGLQRRLVGLQRRRPQTTLVHSAALADATHGPHAVAGWGRRHDGIRPSAPPLSRQGCVGHLPDAHRAVVDAITDGHDSAPRAGEVRVPL